MISFFRETFTDLNSFLLGLITGLLFAWILYKSRMYIPTFGKYISKSFSSFRLNFKMGFEYRYCLNVIQISQRQHLTASMFSLDEIIVEPQLMVPPDQVAINHQTLPIDAVNLTIPYLPEMPELAATYQTPTISIFKALQKGANIALAGNPGSGKTVTLAYLASQVARKEQNLGTLWNLIPIFLHAVDFYYSSDISVNPNHLVEKKIGVVQEEQSTWTKSITATIVATIAKQITTLNPRHLSEFITSALDDKRVIFLLDGMDELSPDRIRNIQLFLKEFIHQYPQVQIIASVSFENLGQLPSLGLQVMALAAWGEKEKNKYLKKWELAWDKLPPKTNQGKLQWRDHQLLSNWLTVNDLPCTPLEMTLKVWGAYEGDFIGSDLPSLLEAYLRRIVVTQSKVQDALERLALQLVVNMEPAIHLRHSDTTPIGYDSEASQANLSTQTNNLLPNPQKIRQNHLSSDLVKSGLIYVHSGARYRFVNPMITGYLAGKALTTYSGLQHILEQPTWIGKSTTLLFFSHFGDVTDLVPTILKRNDFLLRDQLSIAGWLKVSPTTKPWRSILLRALASSLQSNKVTLTLITRIVSSLATSGDPGVPLLLRQLLRSTDDNLRFVAALGSGILKDYKATSELAKLIQDKSPVNVRAACLALVSIGDKAALEIVANSLLTGTEIVRKSAAEALANHVIQGYPTLQDGSNHDDLMVRYSVIYGLMRIQQPWAKEIIEHMQMEDKEWIVRNAATQALEELNLIDANVPIPLPDLIATPWLTDYAAKQGVGVSTEKFAYDLIIDALNKGTNDERLKALYYLSIYGNETSIPIIYSWYFGSTGEVRDSAYQALWLLANSGLSLPPPQQFGFNQ